jgi:hypothetical protein
MWKQVEHIRDQITQTSFMMVVILMCWVIWTTRNDLIFKGIPLDLTRAKAIFAKELKILSMRAKANMFIGQKSHA